MVLWCRYCSLNSSQRALIKGALLTFLAPLQKFVQIRYHEGTGTKCTKFNWGKIAKQGYDINYVYLAKSGIKT